MRVLVAEDDPIAASLLENTLSEWGYPVDLAANGREAIDMLQQTDYRLVICDWQMQRCPVWISVDISGPPVSETTFTS